MRPSAHSDVAEALIRSADQLDGVSHYCPDPASYAFVVLHQSNLVIFGLAYGQSRLAYRLPEDQIEQAVEEGASRATKLGEGWVLFEPWPSNEKLEASRRKLARWCAIANDFALGSDAT